MAAPTALELSHYSTLGLDVQTLPQRRLGKTEERVPLLGLGTGPCGFGMTDEDAIRLIHAAIDCGVTYIDTAPGYDRAQAQLGQVLPSRRDEVFLATKCFNQTAQGALEIIERSLETLGTDHVDLLYSHSMGAVDVDRILRPDGAFAGIREAQRRGWTRFIGFTAHNHPWKCARLLREIDVDVVMLAMNYADRFTYGFERTVAPLARRYDVGLVCMKVYGGADAMDYNTPVACAMGVDRDLQLAFRYALSIPGCATAVIGVYNEQELEQNVRWAQEWTPLSPVELAALDQDGATLAEQWGTHFGPAQPYDV